MIKQKYCPGCSDTKEQSAFAKNACSQDGFQSWCRICRAKYHRNNKEKIAAKTKSFRVKNKDRLKIEKAAYYRMNIEKVKARDVEYRISNKEKMKERDRSYYANNKEKCRESALLRYHKNKEKRRIGMALWARKNLEKINALSAKRRATKMAAIPSWANLFFIEEIYDIAQRRTKATGIEWHVDHIVPLQSKKVCGLHVEHNLQVIPGADNQSKGNRHWPDMPERE